MKSLRYKLGRSGEFLVAALVSADFFLLAVVIVLVATRSK